MLRVILGWTRQSACFIPDTAEDGDLIVEVLEGLKLSPENRVMGRERAVWVAFGKKHPREVLTELAEELMEERYDE